MQKILSLVLVTGQYFFGLLAMAAVFWGLLSGHAG
jgi:hypothetical protein